MNYNTLEYKYNSSRSVIYAKNGMVATSHPLAAEGGLSILKKGGNAIDAAIATAAILTVVEPTSNGIGSDAFSLVWTNDKLYGLNSSGYSPKNISIEKLKERGLNEIPKFGVIPVTVPGAVKAWAELSEKFGKLPLSEVLAPAIKYAEEGHPVSVHVKKSWDRAFKAYSNLDKEEFKYWFDTFTIDGRVPNVGEIWSSKYHAETLRKIAETNGESFYNGEIADKIHDFFKKYDGYLNKDDLSSYKAEWVTPISTNYKGYDIWEIPPNGQGLIALMALNILNGFEFNKSNKEDLETYHKQIEATKLAFADGKKYITDLRNMSVKVKDLLSDEYANIRRNKITEQALYPEAGSPDKGGTVYLATADNEGNMVSFIQSNYMGFGSGIVIPETGIAMQNRGHNFSFNIEDENSLQPGKRTYHTIIPGFMTKDSKPIGPFGVMGGFMQPQGHVQVLMNMIDFDLNPQEALDCPRWQWVEDKTVHVESDISVHIVNGLINKGHNVIIKPDTISFGRGQIIKRNKDGVLVGATEKRTDGHIAAY